MFFALKYGTSQYKSSFGKLKILMVVGSVLYRHRDHRIDLYRFVVLETDALIPHAHPIPAQAGSDAR